MEVQNDERDPIISLILNNTNYSEEEALMKLNEFNNDHIKVIKDYLGIKEKPIEKTINKRNLNQEIMKQMRNLYNKNI